MWGHRIALGRGACFPRRVVVTNRHPGRLPRTQLLASFGIALRRPLGGRGPLGPFIAVRQAAEFPMIEAQRSSHADAVIGMRYDSERIEVVAYGTAVPRRRGRRLVAKRHRRIDCALDARLRPRALLTACAAGSRRRPRSDRQALASADARGLAGARRWHDAAAKADEERYFAHFAEGGVFAGHRRTERWTVPPVPGRMRIRISPRARRGAFGPRGAT